MRLFLCSDYPKSSISYGVIYKIFEKKKIIYHPQIDSAYFCVLLLRLNGFTFRKN